MQASIMHVVRLEVSGLNELDSGTVTRQLTVHSGEGSDTFTLFGATPAALAVNYAPKPVFAAIEALNHAACALTDAGRNHEAQQADEAAAKLQTLITGDEKSV